MACINFNKHFYWTANNLSILMDELHVDSVIKAFGTKQVLTDVYLSCKTGEIIGLLGRNGSGKSTLLKIIFGSLKTDTKFVKVNRKVINSLSDRKKLINYLPQDSFLPGHIKVSTIISMFCDSENTALIKSKAFIKPLLNSKSKTLSSGEIRLVEILVIIFSNAKFVLIDEPFNGIAPIYKQEIKQMIRDKIIYFMRAIIMQSDNPLSFGRKQGAV